MSPLFFLIFNFSKFQSDCWYGLIQENRKMPSEWLEVHGGRGYGPVPRGSFTPGPAVPIQDFFIQIVSINIAPWRCRLLLPIHLHCVAWAHAQVWTTQYRWARTFIHFIHHLNSSCYCTVSVKIFRTQDRHSSRFAMTHLFLLYSKTPLGSQESVAASTHRYSAFVSFVR